MPKDSVGLQNGVTYTFFVRAVVAFLPPEGSRVGGRGRNGVPAEVGVIPSPRRPIDTEDEPIDTEDEEIPENTPPVVAIPLEDQTASVGAPFTYVIPEGAFTDADGDSLEYAARTSNGDALPLWLAFSAATGTFEGTPGPSDGGTVQVVVTARDGTAAVSDEFVLTVLAVHPSMYRHWMARFGRTVADQVLDAAADRMTAPRTPGMEIKLAGYPVGSSQSSSRHAGHSSKTDDIVSAKSAIGQVV